MRPLAVALVALFVLPAALHAAAAGPAGRVWHVTSFDEMYVLYVDGMVIDSKNQPHILFFGDGQTGYAWRDGLEWHVEWPSIPSSAYASIVIDSSDTIYIAYWERDGSTGQGPVHFAERVGDTWKTELVVPRGYAGGVVLAMSTGGTIGLVYRDVVSEEIWYAERVAPGVWTSEVVVRPDRGYVPDLALDAAGGAHVIYEGGGLIYHYRAPGASSWTQERIAPGPRLQDHAIAVDAAGVPHVAFKDNQQRMAYAVRGPAGWATEVINRFAPTGHFPDIAIDAIGRPHVSYNDVRANTRDIFHGHPQYATRADDGTWTYEVVDHDGVTLTTAIALGADGQPHVAYAFWMHQVGVPGPLSSSEDLRYATPILDVSDLVGALG